MARGSLKFSVFLILVGCNLKENTPVATNVSIHVPDTELAVIGMFFDKKASLWKTKNDSIVVSGKIIFFYPNGQIAKIIPVFEGKKEGVILTYYDNGDLKFLETFSNNKLNGKVKRWGTERGYQLIAELNYENGKLHGEQKKWFATGELHKLMHLENGKEEGTQKAYRKNGVLYANYEAVNGRTFGLRRSNLCYELNDEKVVSK